MNQNYWNLLNHIPQNQVDNIVTDSILKMDKMSCDNLLNSILVDKVNEDMK